MGDFRIEINMVGGHGCDRTAKEGGAISGCQRIGCPDCEAKRCVEFLMRHSNSLKSMTITHWPDTPSQVVDEYKPSQTYGYVEGTRKSGSFGG